MDDGVVIDLHHLDSIVVSQDGIMVKVGPAIRFLKLYPALADDKLAVPAGICSDGALR